MAGTIAKIAKIAKIATGIRMPLAIFPRNVATFPRNVATFPRNVTTFDRNQAIVPATPHPNRL